MVLHLKLVLGNFNIEILKRVIIILGFMVLAMVTAIGAFVVLNINARPEGKPGAKAERLADEMLSALGYESYQQISNIEWSFPRGHSYKWNKAEDSVNVIWDQFSVYFSTKTLDGLAKRDGVELSGEEKSKILSLAWEYFANDSFWLVAPFKIKDPGTTREYVELAGAEGLLVHYSSGGVTPGDSYLWILGDDKRPSAWRMWTQKIPIGGLELSWHGWQQLEGAWFAPLHEGVVSIDLTNLKVGK